MLVVDASVALKWLLNEPGSDIARSYMPQWDGDRVEIRHILIAPALILLECHNVLAGRFSRREIEADVLYEAPGILKTLLAIESIDAALFATAYDLSLAPGIPLSTQGTATAGRPFNIYDCLYIALALRTSASLLTADRKQSAVAQSVDVKTILI